jgi:2'-5' RNA ligase
VVGRERLRLFCALRLPDDVLDAIVTWGGGHLRERIVSRPNLHITLAFLGHRPAEELSSIVAATGEAAGSAAPIRLEPVGYRETRSVGMLVLSDEGGAATRIAEDLHGRLQRPRLDPPLPELGPFSPSDAAVYLSRLRPGGAQYEVVQSFALGG